LLGTREGLRAECLVVRLVTSPRASDPTQRLIVLCSQERDLTSGLVSPDDEPIIGRAEGSAVVRPVPAQEEVPRMGPSQDLGRRLIQGRLIELGPLMDGWRLEASMDLTTEEGEVLFGSLVQDRVEDRPL